MNLTRRNNNHDPFDLMSDLQTDLNRMFNRSLTRKAGWLQGFTPEVEVTEGADNFNVSVDLPGVKKDDFKISAEGARLTISGERKEESEKKEKGGYFSEKVYGAFQRTIELPTEVRGDKAKASYKDGVLCITLPKSENSKPRQISVDIE
jgi:HSP20 family protein